MARVTVNKYNIIILDDTVDGKRHRLTTGKKADKRLLKWYEHHASDEFFKLYNIKYPSMANNQITFNKYGSLTLEITKNNRNSFSQKEEMQRFQGLCKTFGDMPLASIKASDIVKWQNDCGFAPKTIRNYRSIFNLF